MLSQKESGGYRGKDSVINFTVANPLQAAKKKGSYMHSFRARVWSYPSDYKNCREYSGIFFFVFVLNKGLQIFT